MCHEICSFGHISLSKSNREKQYNRSIIETKKVCLCKRAGLKVRFSMCLCFCLIFLFELCRCIAYLKSEKYWSASTCKTPYWGKQSDPYHLLWLQSDSWVFLSWLVFSCLPLQNWVNCKERDFETCYRSLEGALSECTRVWGSLKEE